MMNSDDEDDNKRHFVILATSRTREIYDCVSFLFTLWTAIAIPYRLYLVAPFKREHEWSELGYGIMVDYVSDIFFLFNVVLNARFFATTEINEKGKLINITDKGKLFSDYMRSGRLFGDLFTVVP